MCIENLIKTRFFFLLYSSFLLNCLLNKKLLNDETSSYKYFNIPKEINRFII